MRPIQNIRMEMPVLETERLRIRPFQMEDLEPLHAILDGELGGGETLETRRKWIEWSMLNYHHLNWLAQAPSGDRAVVLKDSGELIGACGLAPNTIPYGLLAAFQPPVETPQTALIHIEWGLYYAISPRHQRRGYAVEAAQALLDFSFRELRLHRVVAATERENHASQGVMRRLGMRVHVNPHAEPGWFQVVGVMDNPFGEGRSDG